MDSYNILILCVGRRVELVNCFKKASSKLGIRSVIVGGDFDITAPALFFVDRVFYLPQMKLIEEYVDCIIRASIKNNVRLIVPTIDKDLLILSRNKEKIESMTKAKVLVSDETVINICQNKSDTQKFFENNNFLVPYMYTEKELDDTDNLRFPLFIKPIDGSSSVNAFKVNNLDSLNMFRSVMNNYIVQDYIDGDEYTVDAFLDFESNIITIVPRLRIATRSGEISKGKIEKNRQIITQVRRILELLKPIGQVTIQCMISIRGIEFIEINPRFGGGAPMSIMAGADFCNYLYRLLMDERLEYNEEYMDNLLFMRFDSCISIMHDYNIFKNSK